MKPPKVIYVGPYDYDVKFTKSLGGDLFGETDNTNSELLVHPKQSHSSRRDTLLHEVLHAIFHSSGLSRSLGVDLDREEQIIQILSPWVLAVLKDNPELIAYLTEKK